MTEMRPIRKRGSLLERAAESFDFGSAFAAPEGSRAAPSADDRASPLADMMPIPAGPLPIDGARDIERPRPAVAAAGLAGPGEVARVDRDRLAGMGLLVPGAPVGPLAEEFRLVKRQLLTTARTISGALGDRSRIVLVCSANPNDGKTFCAINLALSLAAERDTDVILVDGDVSKPDIMSRLGVADGAGLLDALTNPDLPIENCVVSTDIAGLRLLPAGTRSNHDTELLASDRTAALLNALAGVNPRRIIIIDSPPILAASPAAALAHHAGQALLVVRADHTCDSDLRDAVNLLDGCAHVQLVLNAVTFAARRRHFGSYYGQEGLA